ncbi:MAG: MBOAT family O-acyltransferase [bacterium]
MSGSSFTFVAFGVLVALLVAARQSLAWRQGVILAASAVFLASLSRNPLAFVPLLGFLLIGFLAVRASEKYSSLTFPLVIAGVLLLFVWLKRYAFVPSSLWISYTYITIGLSYVLFRLLHLIIEGRNDSALARLPLHSYLGYLIGFNTFVAGPIMFYDEYVAEQDGLRRGATADDVAEGSQRIIVGLFKANVLAALLAAMRASALVTLRDGDTAPRQILAGAAVFALYPLFLYCNFAGYIDIVIGLSRLMGQRLPENFDRPFAATSVIDFWNRWHITLSRWLKTYVFNPLLIALLRKFPSRRLEPLWATVAFFITFTLVGIWHGPTTAFLVFGLLTGLGVSVNKLHQLLMTRVLGKKRYGELGRSAMYRVFARGLTFTWFAITLTWFWGSWSVATSMVSAMGRKRWLVAWMAIFFGSSVLLAVWEALRSGWYARESPGASDLGRIRVRTAWLTTLMVIVAVVVFLSSQSAPELVYKDF